MTLGTVQNVSFIFRYYQMISFESKVPFCHSLENISMHKNSSTIYPILDSACEVRAENKMNQEIFDMNILESENIVQHLNIYIFSQISRFGCWNVILYLSLWSLSDWCLHSCIYSLYVAVWIWISDFIIFHLKHFERRISLSFEYDILKHGILDRSTPSIHHWYAPRNMASMLDIHRIDCDIGQQLSR